MTTTKCMLSNFPWNERYRITGLDDVLTPALVVYPEAIAANISQTLQVLGGDADRWRVHIKTAKLSYTLRMLVESGVRNFKCATTLELLMACQGGARDVLVAYPTVGANAICMVHAVLTARLLPQVFVPGTITKSPVITMLCTRSETPPLLVRVTVCAAEDIPTPVAGKVTVEKGERDTPGGATPMPFRVTVCVRYWSETLN